jgi:hypothetical protein
MNSTALGGLYRCDYGTFGDFFMYANLVPRGACELARGARSVL